ncbi:signal transduction histidine kinase [Streptosporangium album]|uniref:histidine kinase n=1 Tax=Streptosporangium album TaxID=47479 RepID=A0A7W7S403_9ACTN|nr:sensor histidine kinase [Streptosporangium album]MBB4943491.1 signal transduction histidine kinase [Streptosporangium album]
MRRDERLKLARELHDVVAHHITSIVLQAQAAQLVARKHPEKVEGSLAGIEATGSDALAATRRVVGLLRDADDAVPAMPGPEQLSELVKRFHGHGPAVRLRLPADGSVWPPEVTSTVYRVVQESLTNISRHAPHARSVTVSVAQDRESVTVEVVDDAPPVPARYHHHRGGYGLVGMRERLEALGGTLCAGPRRGAGWPVLATLPVPARKRR